MKKLYHVEFNSPSKSIHFKFFLQSTFLALFFIIGIMNVKINAQCESWHVIDSSADWEARAGLQAISINDTFYIMGGRTPKAPSDPPIQGDSYIWNDVWRSTDKGENWELILDNDTTEKHWPARAYYQALTRNDSIFILAGQNYKVDINPADQSLVSTSDFFDDVWTSPDGINWTELTDSAGWTGRAGASSVVYNNEIYIMGGSKNDDAAIIGGPPVRIYYNDVWKSSDGKNWSLLTDSAAWLPRAGGIALVKDDYIYMIGGEEGFLCFPGSPCPPYFNDIWRTQNGEDWELVTAEAEWSSRPGHQVVIADNKFVLFGGFGFDPSMPFAPNNPIDVWISDSGAEWKKLEAPPWNATSPTEVKYDFDALVAYDNEMEKDFIYTFGGDRETFNFSDPVNHLNIDNDIWKFCVGSIAVSAFNSVKAQTVISPNPVTSILNFRSEHQIKKIIIFNTNGQTVLNINHVRNNCIQINTDQLEGGLYLAQVHFIDGIETHKIVKK